MQIKLNVTPGYAYMLSVPIKQWLKDRGIFTDLYEIGYDIVDSSGPNMELAPVLRINDGVLTNADLTEFVLRFGA